MKQNKQVKVSYRVTSYEGDSEYEQPSSQAYSEIKRLMEEQNKWVYINGDVKNKELLTEADLIDATEKEQPIILMNALAGGEFSKIIDIDFKVSKSAKKSLVVDIEETKYAKIFNIVIAKEQLADILRNRETLFRVIKKKLEDLVDETTEKFTDNLLEEREEFQDKMDEIEENFDEDEIENLESFEKLLDVELNKYF